MEAGRREEEIEKYASVETVHDLPPICYYYINKFVKPRMHEVFGVSEVEEFYVKYIMQYRAEHSDTPVDIVSIGAGNGDLEVRIAKLLRDRGLTEFRFQCLDINPHMLSRGSEAASQEGIAEHFRFLQIEAENWRPDLPVSIVMAFHSLHHIQALEQIFSNIKQAIGQDGYFLVCDMVGRNGHMRWPEALAIVEGLWKSMPDRYKFNHQLNRFEETYENWDCSKEGFEGIRAQDILALLVSNFHFEAFLAFGNLPDIFTDRGFGPNFDLKNTEDTAFINQLAMMNDQRISDGTLKPTQIIAAMRNSPGRETRCWHDWTPKFCVRPAQCV